jgi:hypothetical protein
LENPTAWVRPQLANRVREHSGRLHCDDPSVLKEGCRRSVTIRQIQPLSLLLLFHLATSQAGAVAFIRSSDFISKQLESSVLTVDRQAHLKDLRSLPTTVHAVTARCDLSAFNSDSVEITTFDQKTVKIARVRQESHRFPSIEGPITRTVAVQDWIGKTSDGSPALFSIGDGGIVGHFDYRGRQYSVESLNRQYCDLYQFDARFAPRDD